MRLKRLLLQGYKTFATKTEFVFDDGITAVVGPNGSGKSNIADAVRWVLGEQSYSALRGKRTTDMIFAGSQSRARAGMAQAILTLDNSEGWLPIDYSEVEIGRRAYRSGENEYLLNGQKMRLRDVQELLSTSGLAERAYAIIGQGLIDQALSLRAEERRALFEEAAGISHYKLKRAETLRRLTETQRNLERLHDILSEIKPRLRSLAQQASRARNYEQVETDLRHLLRIWYGYQWQGVRRRLREQRIAANSAEKHWQESRDRLQRRQEELDGQRRQSNQLQSDLRQKQSEREGARERLEKARRQVAILGERRELFQRQISEIEAEAPDLDQQYELAQQMLAEATGELEQAQTNLTVQQAELRQFQASFQTQQAEIDRARRELHELEQKQRANQSQFSQSEGQLSQLRERLQERETAAPPTAEMAELEQKIERLTAVAHSAQNNAAELQQKRQALQDERREKIQALKAARQNQERQNQRVNQMNNQVARLQARHDLLEQMRSQLRHQESGVNPRIPLLGRLAEQLTIPAEYQTAVEAVLRHRLAALIVPDQAALWQIVNEGGQQTVAVLAAGDVAPPETPPLPAGDGIIGWASELVTAAPEAQAAANLLLGRILLVKNRRAAYEIGRQLPPGCAAVTGDGFIVYAGGLAELRPADSQDSILAREAAWREAAAALAAQKEELAGLQTAVAQEKAAVDDQQKGVDQLNDEERRLQRLENEAGQRLNQAQRDLDRTRQQLSFQQQQQANLTAELEKLRERIGNLERKISGGQAELVEMETAVEAARLRVQALPIAEGQRERQTLRQQVESAQTIMAGRQAVVDSRRATLNQAAELRRRRQARLAELRQQAAAIDLAQEEQALATAQAEMARLDGAITPLQERVNGLYGRLSQLEEEIAVIQKQTHELESHYTQARINLNQADAQSDSLRERIQNDLGLVALDYDPEQVGQSPLPIAEVVEQLPTVAELPEDIEESIQRYRGQLHRMGAINPDAPAEYEETQTRHDFMAQQVEDLEQTEKQLRQIIAELDDLTSRSFAETVEKVNAIFGQTFTRLFGGGAAQLVLTDPDALTISGVDILARLPNRRQQGLGLLSGGERSLTAVALIFSLLQVSPTPFCMLDEVDAMLDEANISRFRDLLLELSANTQFIVITHNRGTVQAAQTVYGISMGADSASQAISLKPEDYVNE
jgi:chromosome segregation protein